MRTALVLVMLCAGVARAEEPDAARLAELATVAHKHAQKTKDPKKYEEAAGYYEKYFAKPRRQTRARWRSTTPSCLFNLQRYDEAAKMYERTVTVEPKGKFADEAAYACVISTKNAIHDRPADGKPPCPDQTSRARFPRDQQRLLTAFDRYLTIVTPTSKDRATMEYRRARVFYEYNHFAEAAPHLRPHLRRLSRQRARHLLGEPRDGLPGACSSATTSCARSSSGSRRARS